MGRIDNYDGNHDHLFALQLRQLLKAVEIGDWDRVGELRVRMDAAMTDCRPPLAGELQERYREVLVTLEEKQI